MNGSEVRYVRQNLTGQKDKYTDWMARKLSMFAKHSSAKQINQTLLYWLNGSEAKCVLQESIGNKDEYTDWTAEAKYVRQKLIGKKDE